MTAETRRHRLRNVALVLAAWTAAALFFFTQDVSRSYLWRDPTPWWHFLTSWLVGVYLFALFTPLVLWLGRRFPFERGRRLRHLALHLAASFAVALMHLLLDSVLLLRLPILPAIQPRNFATMAFVLFTLGFHGNVMTYWLVLGIQQSLRTWQRYQEREKEALRLELHATELRSRLVEAQLSGLKMQLQPHFLFNTLNAVMVLVRQQRTSQAEEMLARLSDLLRRVLDEGATQEVPLRRELDLLEVYLAIEQVRFQDRLRVDIGADPAVLDAAVPHLGLQPIVENAVRHGIGARSAAGHIGISAVRVDDRLEIRVRDDGPGTGNGGRRSGAGGGAGAGGEGCASATAGPSGGGIGLANTRMRLRQLYGDNARLTLENHPEGGAVATMILPFHLAEPPDAEGTALELWA